MVEVLGVAILTKKKTEWRLGDEKSECFFVCVLRQKKRETIIVCLRERVHNKLRERERERVISI
jgi:hypothetical protein